MDFCKYVDPFYGNGVSDLPEPDETASKWFFLKAQVGNTTPAATIPFCATTACAYTGGYPTGYGPYLANSYSRPKKFLKEDKITALGFSHFHQSGTGFIGEFYNYSIITPVSGKTHQRFDRYPLTDEIASPAFYSCKLGDTNCKTTVAENAVIYEYHFFKNNNIIVFDPILNGIFKNDKNPDVPLGELISVFSESHITTQVKFSNNVQLFTAIHIDSASSLKKTVDGRFIFTIENNTATVKLGFSFKSVQSAISNLEAIIDADFETLKVKAKEIWNSVLSKIQIEADDEYKTKFYSNLYHSFIKPVKLTDNCFGAGCDCYADIATMWDISKTQLPLIFTLFNNISSEIINSFLNAFELYGKLPNSYLLSGCDILSDHQARALSVNSIYDAYLRGIEGVDWDKALKIMIAELNRNENTEFFNAKPVSEYPSHTIDIAIAAYSIASLSYDLGHKDIAEKYFKLSENWQVVYNKTTGAVSETGKFYEGCNLNYSFRLLPDMDKRIDIAGGKEKFKNMLDEFFGFDKKAAKQCLNPSHLHLMRAGKSRRGFEGFNNETDMETPYCYSYIGRSDITCQIVSSAEKYLYGANGKGALCGNDDSGALSSLYVVNSLGLFPVFGQDKVILVVPRIKQSVISLSNGNTLTIIAQNAENDCYIPKEYIVNGKKISAPFISVRELMRGGTIEFI